MWNDNSNQQQSLLTAILVFTLLVTGLAIPAAAQKPTPTTQAQTLAPFPRTYKTSTGGLITLFEPQVASWFGQKHMVAWSAISYSATAAAKPAIGSIKMEADTDVSIDARLVRFKSFEIPEVNFASLSRDDSKAVAAALKDALPTVDRVLSLDKVLAAVDKSELLPKSDNAAEIKADPPTVFYTSTPGVLVGFDGDPVWSPIKDVDLKYAVNTNWDVFEQPTTKTFYLRKDANWFKSSDVKTGWAPAGKLPDSFSKLPADDNWKDVKANLPGKNISASAMPKLFVTTVPAEVIVTDGPAKYTPVTGTSLLWVNNTESDIFRNGASGNFYYLVAGRWFSGPSLDGPWTFATTSLPADFKNIPVEHPRSRVLASVPGTQQATEAVLQASVPRTATIDKTQLKAPDVAYQGEPNFEPIKDTTLWRAVNTDKQVIKSADKFYLCYQAVWFVANSAKGPWAVATTIPAEIYKIPASSPVHNVTYVTIYDDNPSDNYVNYSYTAAYTGVMIGWGCAVWGTGWYYPPYIWYGGYYPIYYPYYRTYGYAAWYNPYMGTYGRGAAVYGPYGGVGFGAVYNPGTGTYARGAVAYGPYGATGFAQAYNPRTGTYAQTRQSGNVYGNWGSSYVQRGDDWAQTGHMTNNVTGNSIAGARTSNGGALVTGSGDNGRSTIAKTPGGDVYAGHDGNVYRKTDDGFQKYENGGWTSAGGGNAANASKTASSAQRPTTTQRPSTTGGLGGMDSSTYNQLNRDAANRAEGMQRTNSLGNYNMGGRSSAGSYRGGGGGGGFRGGGGGRRR